MLRKCKVSLLVGLLALILGTQLPTVASAQQLNISWWQLLHGFCIDCEALLKGIGKQLPEDPSAVLVCAVKGTNITAFAANPGDQFGDRSGIPFEAISDLVASASASNLWEVEGKGKVKALAEIPDLALFRSVFGYPLPEGEYEDSPYEDSPNYQVFIAALPNPNWQLVTPELDPNFEWVIVNRTPAYVATYLCDSWQDDECVTWQLKNWVSSRECVLQEDDTYLCDEEPWADIPEIPNFPTP